MVISKTPQTESGSYLLAKYTLLSDGTLAQLGLCSGKPP